MVYGQTDIVHALSVMNLKTLHDRFAAHLSAGQKRRLGLARFLVTGCKIWIMDEPTVSLDASSTELFQNMLSTHLASGGIAVIATHIELGLIGAMTLDLNQYRANIETQSHQGAFDEAMI
jgi:heme exporter protein A